MGEGRSSRQHQLNHLAIGNSGREIGQKRRDPSVGHHRLSRYAGLSPAHDGDADRRRGQHNGRGMARDFGWDITHLDDLAQLWFGTGPQIDGLGHLGESGVY